MNYLQRSEENYSANYCQNKRVVYDIFFCQRIVKRSEQLHYILILLQEFNNVLPSLEICDQMKRSSQKNEWIFIYLIFKNNLILKMNGDSHD